MTNVVRVSTPRCVQVISVLICSSSHFSRETRFLAKATSDFNKSGSYFVLTLLVDEHTVKNKQLSLLKIKIFRYILTARTRGIQGSKRIGEVIVLILRQM